MKTVEVLFQNIQSHENTRFVLKPGMNFILADGNNVGKSTIFKVLSRIAKAPNINSNKLLPLIRYGKSEALAAFKFDNESVVARFTKYDREAAKVFFEHTHADGEITRSAFCPKSLLDALGIVVGENGEIINFNDANSVQLISEVSADADTVITHVMLDANIESVKQNIYMLGREVNMDLKTIGAQVDTAENIVKDLTYKPAVAEFNEDRAKLEAACRVCDYGLVEISTTKTVPSAEEMATVKRTLDCVSAVDRLLKVSNQTVGDCNLRYGMQLVQLLQKFDSIDFSVLHGAVISSEDLQNCKRLYSVVSKMLSAVRSAESLNTSSKRLLKAVTEKQSVFREIESHSVEVVCPVKGRVAYTDEKCVPYSS